MPTNEAGRKVSGPSQTSLRARSARLGTLPGRKRRWAPSCHGMPRFQDIGYDTNQFA